MLSPSRDWAGGAPAVSDGRRQLALDPQGLVGVVSAIKANTVDFMVALDPAVLFGEAQLEGGGEEGYLETV